MSQRTSLTPYQQFTHKWADGCESELCCSESRVVLARGRVPCDILFIGEAPGESENILGKPFCGPAGYLLDEVVRRATRRAIIKNIAAAKLAFGYTNLVCCIPRDTEQGGKLATPPDKAVLACKPRLEEFISLCKPNLVVSVGSLSRDWLDQQLKKKVVVPPGTRQAHITHPAALLRLNEVQRDFAVKRCVIILADAMVDLVTLKNEAR